LRTQSGPLRNESFTGYFLMGRSYALVLASESRKNSVYGLLLLEPATHTRTLEPGTWLEYKLSQSLELGVDA
jgi:hypothetical protein